MKNVKITSILIISSISIFILAGCSSNSMKKPTIPKAPVTTNTGNNIANTETKKSDTMVATEKIYIKTLKGLVTAKTITQAQSDKVLAVVTSNIQQGTASTGTITQNPTNTNNGTGTDTSKNQTGTSDITAPRNNVLSGLVSSGVINQAQADTINQKIRAAMKNNQNKR